VSIRTDRGVPRPVTGRNACPTKINHYTFVVSVTAKTLPAYLVPSAGYSGAARPSVDVQQQRVAARRGGSEKPRPGAPSCRLRRPGPVHCSGGYTASAGDAGTGDCAGNLPAQPDHHSNPNKMTAAPISSSPKTGN